MARDVAIVLQYTNPAEAVRDHCKHVKILKTSDSSAPFPVPPRGLQVIPEGDVYRLVCRSRLPAAVKFQKWLFGEVLPSIRKRGGYVAVQPEMTEQELLARAVLVATETIKRVQQAKDNRSLCADASIGLPLTLDVTASPSSSPPDTGNSKK